MSRFYLTMKARNAGQTVTRRAHAGHGAHTICASYSGAVECTPYVNESGADCVRIVRRPWEGSGGPNVMIFDGPFDISAPGYATDLR